MPELETIFAKLEAAAGLQEDAGGQRMAVSLADAQAIALELAEAAHFDVCPLRHTGRLPCSRLADLHALRPSFPLSEQGIADALRQHEALQPRQDTP